jgi:hypothetical protein
MSNNVFRQRPLNSLHELLTISVSDMLASLDPNEDNVIAFRAKRKQVELLLTVIDEKVNEREIQQTSKKPDCILVL